LTPKNPLGYAPDSKVRPDLSNQFDNMPVYYFQVDHSEIRFYIVSFASNARLTFKIHPKKANLKFTQIAL